jgi:hypothetical protein
LAGLFLALVITNRPFYAPLALPLLWPWFARAAPARRSAFAVTAGLAGALALVLLGNQLLQGSWSSYAAPRASFSSAVGFPEGSTTADWESGVGERGSNAWTGPQALPFGFDFAETRWNVLYLLMGRHVGLFPYQAGAFLLGLLAFRGGREGWTLALGFALVAAAFLVVRPFNFWGGGGALANRYLLPAVPALWFLGARRVHGLWLGIVALVAAPFLWPAWSAPRSFLLASDSTYRLVAPIAERLLPYETTQSHLKPAGMEDFVLRSPSGAQLWSKPLSRGVQPSATVNDSVRLLRVDPSRPNAHLLVATPVRLNSVDLLIEGRPNVAAKVHLGRTRAHHRMWWSEDRWFLYELDLAEGLLEAGVSEPVEVRLEWR